jgi:hypothetical protein
MLFRNNILLFLPLILSAFTHLWNPIGFPFPNVDEGIYLGRAVNFMDTLNPKDPYIGYDHPYFGQIFLAGYLYVTGYQNFLNSDSSINYEMLLLSPRILMGLLAILNTFLIFKIVEFRYTTKTAFIASMLFAVMPITWLTRWVLLDSIQLPFILLSILFSILPLNNAGVFSHRKNILFMTLSGIFLGLSVFTKIPSFTLIPLVGYLVFKQNKNNLKVVMLWLVPVVFIPSLWVIHATIMDEFEQWWEDAIYHQTHRESRPLYIAMQDLFTIDPLLLFIGIPSLVYALIKRDLFIILSIIPFLVFLYLIDYVVVFHLIFFGVILCVSIGILFSDIVSVVRKKNHLLLYSSAIFFAVIVVLGMWSITQHLVIDLNSQYFRAATFVDNYLYTGQRGNDNLNDINSTEGTTVISHPFFFWVYKYKFHDTNYYYWSFPKFEKLQVISIVDGLFREVLDQNNTEGMKFKNLFSSFNTTRLLSLESNAVQNNKLDILLTDLNQYNKSKIKLIELLDDNFSWNASKDVKTQQENGELNITVDTTNNNEKDNINFAYPETILNLTRSNSYLFIKYIVLNHSKDSTFTLELNDAHNNQSIWNQNLKIRSKTIQQFFILPEDISGKRVSLNVRINDYERGIDSIILKDLKLYY